MADSTANEDATAQQPAIPLFRLPAELRNRIYELVLMFRHPLGAHRDLMGDWEAEMTPCNVAQPALARTCRAIRSESLPIFYAQNTFVVTLELPEEERAVRLWLEAIGGRNRGYLGRLFVERGEYRSYFLRVVYFHRARSRFLKRLKYEREVLIEGEMHYVVKLEYLTIDE